MPTYYAVRTIPVTHSLAAPLRRSSSPLPWQAHAARRWGTLKEMALIDSHAHLDFYIETPTERDEVLRRAYAAGVHSILAIGIGDGPATMQQALEIADSTAGAGLPQGYPQIYPQIYASAGIHPQEAAHATSEALEKLAALGAQERCIAVGEIGLDYYHFDNPDIATQKQAFIAQMRVAAKLRKPILIHCRTSEPRHPAGEREVRRRRHLGGPARADRRALDAAWAGGIMHCFSGTVDQAEQSLAAGFHLSFAGNLTYPRAQGIRDAAVAAPADRILVETDAPFLAPIPLRGQRNEPALVVHTAAALAELRGISPEELATLTTENFKNLFPTTR
ncbi:TatD family hydrolase [Tunturiibacter empetritectus]|uniref:TatD family hydrolase n=1 Tax=Tunturiibacter empetritectus TaxID=3069691 RepID=UPI003D9B67BF